MSFSPQSILRLPFFDPIEYLRVNEDVARAGMPASEHYWEWGHHEDRPLMSAVAAARMLGGYDDCSDAPRRFPYLARGAPMPSPIAGQRVALLTASEGNFYMDEIADHVAHGLQSLGVEAIRGNEHSTVAASADHIVIVAPHEYYAMKVAPVLPESAVMLNTEQIQTVYFARALPRLLRSGRVVDINYQLACMFQDAGLETLYFVPGYASDLPNCPPVPDIPRHALSEGLPRHVQDYVIEPDEFARRPIDVTFLGNESLIRNEFLARNATFFAARLCQIVYRQRPGPMVPDNDARDLPKLNSAVGRRSKVVLNIHRDGVGYFEWSRIVLQGIWQKAVVVTNPCSAHPVFKAGEHYFEESLTRIPKLIAWLIDTEEGRVEAERVRAAAFHVLVEQCPLRRSSLALMEFLCRTRR